MVRSLTQTFVVGARLFEVSCVLLALLVVLALNNAGELPNGSRDLLALRLPVTDLMFAASFVLIWKTVFSVLGLYGARRESPSHSMLRIIEACTLAAAYVALLPLTRGKAPLDFRVVSFFWLVCIGVVATSRATLDGLIRFVGRHLVNRKQAIIVGSGPRALALFEAIQQGRVGRYHVVGFVDSRNSHEVPPDVQSRMLGPLEALEDILVQSPVDQVLIALPVKSCYSDIQQTIQVCERIGVESNYRSDLFALSLARQRFDEEDTFPVVTLQVVADDARLLVKRSIDLLGAITLLVVCSPVMCLCALAVKRTPGPIFFSQLRYGLNRRCFRMYKFRTMVEDAEGLQQGLEALNEVRGPVFKIQSDPRVTRVGRLLRKASLDELPQLFNVLKGEMSLVGPRPLPVRDVSRFNEARLMRRFSVKPGLTCLWQVSGRSNTNFDRWVELDLQYIDNWSLALDFKILLKTVPVVISGTGAV